jgi:hypothetical protein
MATKPFFQHFDYSLEQDLFQDLVQECIQLYGLDMWYIPRNINNYDKIFGADDISSFDTAILVDWYLENVEGFEGDGTFMSKFGLQINDRVSFSVAQKTWNELVSSEYQQLVIPRAGDLLYYPLDKKCFEILYVDKKVFHYPLGVLPTFRVDCELFEFSNEKVNTGIAEIDALVLERSINILDYSLKDQEGKILVDQNGIPLVSNKYDLEVIDNADNDQLVKEADDLLDFSEINPFSEPDQ